MMRKRQLVTAANGFAPVPLNFANFASTYIPADIQHRLGQTFGLQSRYITGVDLHGRHASRAFKAGNFTDQRVANEFYKDKYENILSKFDVHPSQFIHTDHPDLQKLNDMVYHNLKQSNHIQPITSDSFFCHQCSDYVSVSEVTFKYQNNETMRGKILNQDNIGSCKICHTDSVEHQTEEQYSLTLLRDDYLQAFIDNRHLPPILSRMVKASYNSDFLQWGFTRNQHYNGAPLPKEENKRFYLWYESMVSKFLDLGSDNQLSSIQEGLGETTIKSFFGKNIINYYTLVFPTILNHGLDCKNYDLQLCARGFCMLEKSDKDMCDIDKVLQICDTDYLRAYSAYTVDDDVRDFVMTHNEYSRVSKHIFDNTILKYLKSAYEIIGATNLNEEDMKSCQGDINRFKDLVDHGQPRKVLLQAEAMARLGLKSLNRGEITPDNNKSKAHLFLVAAVMNAYMPGKISGIVPGCDKISFKV